MSLDLYYSMPRKPKSRTVFRWPDQRILKVTRTLKLLLVAPTFPNIIKPTPAPRIITEPPMMVALLLTPFDGCCR